ncbi:hypothetical protein ACWCWD_06465 [Streptomyces sp. NPDC001493]
MATVYVVLLAGIPVTVTHTATDAEDAGREAAKLDSTDIFRWEHRRGESRLLRRASTGRYVLTGCTYREVPMIARSGGVAGATSVEPVASQVPAAAPGCDIWRRENGRADLCASLLCPRCNYLRRR